MRKAKTAAIIFGGVSTCLFGGLFGVYATAPVVSSVTPEDDAQSIYNVQSKELANTAVFTSIGTTITKTSIEFTTANAVTTISAETTASPVSYDTYSTMTVTSSAPITATAETTAPVYTDKVITADAMCNIVDEYTEEEEVSENIVDFGISLGNLSDCFIASDEISEETAEDYSWETPAEDYNKTDDSEYNEYIDSANEYLDGDYSAPAFEYIVTSPVTSYDNTDYSTTTTTTETYSADYSYDDYYNEYYNYYSDYYSELEITAETVTETTAVATETTAETTTTTTETTVETETSAETETSTVTETQTTAIETTTTETTTTTVTTQETYLPITDSEYILLCNAVANEAGSNWIGLYEKGNVVEVIMNRVNSPLYPNTIVEVITQVNQFTGSENYAYLGTYSQYVTEDVKAAVDLYFNEPSSFSQNYFGFYGDGFQNYFY